MKIRTLLSNNYKLLGLGGIISSWFTIGMVWVGMATLPIIGFCVTGSLLGLALLGTGR